MRLAPQVRPACVVKVPVLCRKRTKTVRNVSRSREHGENLWLEPTYYDCLLIFVAVASGTRRSSMTHGMPEAIPDHVYKYFANMIVMEELGKTKLPGMPCALHLPLGANASSRIFKGYNGYKSVRSKGSDIRAAFIWHLDLSCSAVGGSCSQNQSWAAFRIITLGLREN